MLLATEPSTKTCTVRVAGVVVLYQSPPSTLDAIQTYWQQVEKLYVIDNSPVSADWITEWARQQATISYHQLEANPGIAAALNRAAQLAFVEGFDYLLTMDDDSQAPADLVAQMLTYLAQPTTSDQIGILSPHHVLTTAPLSKSAEPEKARPVMTTMTSGNLLNLRIYQAVGPFLESLFIDVVDHEYYLRLQQLGYQVVELPWVQLTHRLGLQKKRLGLSFVSHNPLRNYYLVRNSVYVARRYPTYLTYALKSVLLEAVKAILLEDQPFARLQKISQGVADGLRGRLGKRPA